MLRRDFIKATGTVIAASALPGTQYLRRSMELKPAPFCRSIATGAIIPPKSRARTCPRSTTLPFERVVIPHTNVSLPWHNFDDKDYEFISTYRRRFRYPARRRASASSWTSKAP